MFVCVFVCVYVFECLLPPSPIMSVTYLRCTDQRSCVVSLHVFFHKKMFCKENEPQKPKNLKEMLKKPPAWNTWAPIFKKADFS